MHDSTLSGRSSLTHLELMYAKKVVSYNQTVASGGIRPDLMGSFTAAFNEETEQAAVY